MVEPTGPARPTVAVFASSSADVAPHYRELADELGTRIGTRDWTLLYGGTLTGMMRSVADAARASGGAVVAVTMQQFVDVGIHDVDADELVVAATLTERKAAMLARADAFVVLPGGLGTLDEAVEVLAWHRLAAFATPALRPLVFLDHRGFWAPLLGQVEVMAREGMLASGDSSAPVDVPSASEELQRARGAHRHLGHDVAADPAAAVTTLARFFAGD